jgi:hypothetical protein
MIDELTAALADLARRGEIISYGALARQLEIAGPGSIARLTDALEATMSQDATMGRPLRAALCHARGSDLPAIGFFDAARKLGRNMQADPTGLIALERKRLFTGS